MSEIDSKRSPRLDGSSRSRSAAGSRASRRDLLRGGLAAAGATALGAGVGSAVAAPAGATPCVRRGRHALFPLSGREYATRAVEIMERAIVVTSHADRFVRIDDAADFGRAKAKGKIGILLGIQNTNHFTRSHDTVDRAWSLGHGVSQLTCNSRNRIGNGATERVDGGISNWGAAVTERMNRVGMAIDVSHCGDRTTLDAFDPGPTDGDAR